MSVIENLNPLLLVKMTVKGVVHVLLECLFFVFEKMCVLVLDAAIQSCLL